MIVKGIPNPDLNQERIVFGPHALVYTGTSNDTDIRSIPSIALKKSNIHLGRHYMNLYTGKRLHIYECTDLPIDNNVIEKVKHFSSDEKGPLVKDKYPMFEWAPSIPILDETQKEAPYMIDEDEMDVEDAKINDYDNGQEEDEDEQGLNIKEE